MVRSISSELLDAARSLRARPDVALSIRNKRLRWRGLRYTETGQYASDQTADSAAGNSIIHRARVDEVGRVQHCAVTDPASAAQWVAWATLNQEGLPGEDCALACPAAGTLRLFYLAAPLTPTLRCVETSDGGANWSASADIAPVGAGPCYLAAASLRAFAIVQGVVKVWLKALGGAWSAGPDWAALGTLTAPTGIGVAWDSANALYRVIVAGDGRLWVGSLSASTGWSEPQQIWPGGNGAALADAVPYAPAALCYERDYWFTWVETYQATPAWSQAVICHTRAWGHFGQEAALQIDTSAPRRVALAYVASTRCLYAANETDVCVATRWDSTDPTQNLEGLTVREYERHTDERGSRISVELIDSAEECASLGVAGRPAEPVQPLAEVYLERGYLVGNAPQRETLDPHYLMSAAYTTGRQRGRLLLRAVDGWGLLGLWHPPMPLTWENRSVRWLLAELTGRVGLAYADNGALPFDYVVPTFTALPGQSGAAAVRALLGLAGAVARFTADGTLYALNLYGHAPLTYVDLGEKEEILEGQFGPVADYGTAFRVYGDGVGYATENMAASMSLGLRLHRQITDYRLHTEEQVQQVGVYYWLRSIMSARRETVTIPLRPDPELWDLSRLFLDPDVVPPAEAMRRVVGIAEEYHPWQGQYLSRLTLEQG